MQQKGWYVGSNGNWFRDTREARYCIHMRFDGKHQVLRNGEDIGAPITATAEGAKAYAEDYAEHEGWKDADQ